MKGNYAAGIVLFNPEISRLENNIESIKGQVELVILFDNGSSNINEIDELINKNGYKNVKIIKSSKNKGIAYALNIITNNARELGYEWILTLDQDSVTQSGTIEEFDKYTTLKDVAIICPYVIDKRRKNIKYDSKNKEYEEIDFAITSGSLININIWDKIGKFDEWLFIGLVDNDYCERVNLLGYKILQINKVILDHELGNLRASKFEKVYLKLGDMLSSETIKKLSYKREVSALRLYYSTRNLLYMHKKYKIYEKNKYSMTYIIKNSISNILRGKNKIKLAKQVYKGFIDGLNKEAEQFNVNKI